MRIAVDARPLASPLTGIGRYTHELLKRLIRTDHEWFLYSDRPLQADFPNFENTLVRIGDASGGTPGSLRWAQWEFVRWAKRDRVQIFWSPRHHLPLLLPSGVGTVVTIHDLVWKRYPETMQLKNYWLERILMERSANKADKIICVSEFSAGEVRTFFPQCASKTSVIHEGTLPTTSNTESPTIISEPYLLFVGTQEPRKNLQRLLKAFAQTKEPRTKLVIAGTAGWGGIEVDSWIRELKIQEFVVNVGYVSDHELESLYRHATALVMPSLYEGFGLPAVEAMKYGVPSIVSRGTSLEEICGTSAILIDPLSTEEIALAMSQILDPNVHNRLSAAAKKQAPTFDWDIAAEQTLDVLIDPKPSSLRQNRVST